jgi:hypothetical protein
VPQLLVQNNPGIQVSCHQGEALLHLLHLILLRRGVKCHHCCYLLLQGMFAFICCGSWMLKGVLPSSSQSINESWLSESRKSTCSSGSTLVSLLLLFLFHRSAFYTFVVVSVQKYMQRSILRLVTFFSIYLY